MEVSGLIVVCGEIVTQKPSCPAAGNFDCWFPAKSNRPPHRSRISSRNAPSGSKIARQQGQEKVVCKQRIKITVSLRVNPIEVPIPPTGLSYIKNLAR